MTSAVGLRTHRAGELTADDVGTEVVLCGWVATRRDHGGVAFVAPLDTPAIQAAARAYAAVFGLEPLYMRSGGGIPIVTILHDVLDAPVVLMGFGLPDDNLHAPNEKFLLANFYRGIATSAAFLHELTA